MLRIPFITLVVLALLHSWIHFYYIVYFNLVKGEWKTRKKDENSDGDDDDVERNVHHNLGKCMV